MRERVVRGHEGQAGACDLVSESVVKNKERSPSAHLGPSLLRQLLVRTMLISVFRQIVVAPWLTHTLFISNTSLVFKP